MFNQYSCLEDIVMANFMFQGEGHVYNRPFHVLRDSICDVVLGKAFLDETETLTKNSHRIFERMRLGIQKDYRFFLLKESPTELLRCTLNGADALAFADTGSDLMLVSGGFVRRNQLEVHRGEEYRRPIEFIDGSTTYTDGMVLNAELQFDIPQTSARRLNLTQYLNFIEGFTSIVNREQRLTTKPTFLCDLHVIENLPCDIILSNEFIFQNQIFSDQFRSLLQPAPDDLAANKHLLFVRNKETEPALPWLPRLRRLLPWQTSVTSLPVYNNAAVQTPVLLVPMDASSSWEQRWRIEEGRRNHEQLRIATLREPSKSVEQRSENDKQALWDMNNPRPRVEQRATINGADLGSVHLPIVPRVALRHPVDGQFRLSNPST